MKDHERLPARKSDRASIRCQTIPPSRILVVDCDPSFRQLSAEVLTHFGYEVDIVTDGASAWQTLTANSHDLLITDHRTPKVSAVELLKKLRVGRMAIPVIIATAMLPTEESARYP